MKQELDKIRTLAGELFEAAQREKRRQPKEIWGEARYMKFREVPSETVAVMDAMAIQAYKSLKPENFR